ncbi:MAG TPA: hypothetical protein VF432_13930 [Thermoanaerobaculia bacterium]
MQNGEHDVLLAPAAPRPEALVQGLRLLRERIPGYHVLSREEERSILRTAYLDPELIQAGLAVAEVWSEAAVKSYTGLTADELHALDAEIRQWDDVERDLRVLLAGIVGANRRRKHRRGKAILALYRFLAIALTHPSGDTHLRPYFETMRRAYMKNRRPRGKAATSPPPPESAAGSSD